MITKHSFVSVLDVDEQLPLVPKETHAMEEHLKEQERVRQELVRFIGVLQKKFKERIYYLGSEVIEGKSFQEFMFQGSGFLEISGEPPIAINAHFHDQKRARKFAVALKGALADVVPQSKTKAMFLDSIDVKDEHEVSLTFQKWAKMHHMESLLHQSVSFVILSLAVFVIIEIGEELFMKLFSSLFQVHYIIVTIVIAVLIALLFRPFEKLVDKVVSKMLFRK